MSSPARVDKMITLEQFLRLPEIDEHTGTVLVGYRLPVAELFGWLSLRRPDPLAPSQPGCPASGESTR